MKSQKNNLKVTDFLIEALKNAPNNKSVVQAYDSVLSLNLEESKNNYSPSTFNTLKETKAEMMYHGFAESPELASNARKYVNDPISKNIYNNVYSTYKLHELQSANMLESLVSN